MKMLTAVTLLLALPFGAFAHECPCETETVSTHAPSADTAEAVALSMATEFLAVSDIDQPTAGAQLIGGSPVVPADYPASFYARHGSGACTGVMVSEQVLLTAAHCVTGSYKATLKRAGVEYRASCDVAPEYLEGEASADYALCLLDRPMRGIAYERVSLDSKRVKKNATVLLTGFGCITAEMTLGNDGIYRSGSTQVVELPKKGGNTIVTQGGVALCPGDSGGPAFIQNAQGRLVISVNSAVRIVPGSSPKRVDPRLISHLASLSTPTARGFIEPWRTARSVKICGLDAAAAGCR